MVDDTTPDDDRLLADLGAAVRSGDAVPDRFRAAGTAAYGWRTVDAELAELEAESSALAGARAPDAPRTLRFRAGDVTVEVELTDALQGQVEPPRAGEITLESTTGAPETTAVDEVGWFLFPAVPTGPFRLRLRPAAGPAVVTAWTRP
jgi:hypothetical protein